MTDRESWETIESKPHWISAWRVATILVAVLGLLWMASWPNMSPLLSTGYQLLAALALVFAALQAIFIAIWLTTTKYMLTPTGVYWKTGLFRRRRGTEIAYSSMTNIDAIDTPLGRWLGYGFIRINDIGGEEMELRQVRRHNEFYKELERRRQIEWEKKAERVK